MERVFYTIPYFMYIRALFGNFDIVSWNEQWEKNKAYRSCIVLMCPREKTFLARHLYKRTYTCKLRNIAINLYGALAIIVLFFQEGGLLYC